MTVRETLQQFLDALGAQTGARFALDARGAACIRFNDTVEIVAEAQEQLGLFFLHAPVCSLEPAGRVEVIEHAFSLALFGLGTGGCVIGYDRPGDRLVLSASRPCGRMDAAADGKVPCRKAGGAQGDALPVNSGLLGGRDGRRSRGLR